ncbi:MAG: ComEC/Rec2 family competence protein [Patescibacteria group bacterium]|nr:ComEC/Rec2 family competence protein [Patescibacteria group bacterium]
MASRYVLGIALGFFSGVILATWWGGIDWALAGFLVLVSLVLLATRYLVSDRPRLFLCLALILIGVALGAGRLWLNFDDTYLKLASQADQKVQLEGVVVEEPDQRDDYTRLIVRLKDEDFKILITAPLYPTYRYGDELALTGKLRRPENFTGDAGREFDYVNYLAKDDIRYQLYQPGVTLLARDQGNWLKGGLLKIKGAFLGRVNLILPEPESSLLAGLLLGTKQSLGSEWLERFQIAGVSHIIVLSGYNVTIIADNLIKFFAFIPALPRAAGWSLGGLSIILFAIMTGAGPTVLRASLMALIALFGRATGRVYDASLALLIAALMMVLINPQILVYDIGFQLSFLATLGLIYLLPALERSFSWLAPRKVMKIMRTWWALVREGIRSIAVSTIAAQIAVLPWLLYKMGILSFVALPANLLILASIPLTMFFGLFAGLLAFISTWLAWPFALLAHAFLSYQLLVVQFLSDIPLAAINIPLFPWWAAVLAYVLLGYWIARPKLP